MKLIVEISDETYKSIQDNDYCGISNGDMYNSIKDGVPLSAYIEKIKALYPQYGDGLGWEESRKVTLNEVIKILNDN